MNKAILCIGIDQFDKSDITPLAGAAQDARRWAGFFEHRLGFATRVLTHEDLKAGARVFDVVEELLAVAGGPGDLFGVFVATHGKEVRHAQGGYDQAFFLPHARLASIEAGSVGEGVLSLRQLALETARQGLQRFFIIDACRAPLKRPPAGAKRDAQVHFEAEGQLAYRQQALRFGHSRQVESPLTIVNACANKQRAAELRTKRRGVFSMAAEEVAAQRVNAGLPLRLDGELLASVGARMRQLAQSHDEDALMQDPVIDQGGGLCLWAPASAPASTGRPAAPAQTHAPATGSEADAVGTLLKRFAQQLQAGRLHNPAWDCCTGTLALLHAAGLDEAVLGLLQRQLEAAALPAPQRMPNPEPVPQQAPAAPAPAASAAARRPRRDMPAGTEFRDADWAPRMVVIPAGRYLMGSPENELGRRSDEGPQHEVQIRRAFAMGRTVVTFDDYDRYAKEAKIALPDDEGWGRGTRPVINVSWEDAQAYIAWLNRKLKLAADSGYRLPSEAEWEYAARAGSTTPFWWGNTITPAQANYCGNLAYANGAKGEDRRKTVPADALSANHWGLYNVHGNVWEWVEDWWHDDYTGAPVTEQAWEGGSDKPRRVVRGGSWGSNPVRLRSANRFGNAPVSRGGSLGFRLARTF
jgi:formylglycine-generating enzyme required for sulfatase activity